MEIETVSNPEHEVEVKFENLPRGTVFEFEVDGRLNPIALKLADNKYTMLTYSGGFDWFSIGEGGMAKQCKIVKVWGHLVGLKVQL